MGEEAAVSLELASLKPPPKSVTHAGGPVVPLPREPMVTAWRPAAPARPTERGGVVDAIASVSGGVYKRLFVYPLIAIPIYWLFIRTERVPAIVGLAIASLIGLIGLVVRAVR
jgi:hypothetical protein